MPKNKSKYIILRDVLYNLIDETISLCSKMQIYSCFNGVIGSDAYNIQKGLMKILLDATEKYNDAILSDYLFGFEPNVQIAQCNGCASNYEYNKRLEMCKLLVYENEMIQDGGDFKKISELPPKHNDKIYIQENSIKEVDEFLSMVNLLQKYIYKN